MAVELFSFPTELIWHILLILTPQDICRCAITCEAFWNVIRNSVRIQYKLELYAQGFTETATLHSIGVSRKMSLLKKSASLWRSGLHLNTVFEERVMISTFPAHPSLPSLLSGMKCGLLWMLVNGDIFVRDYNTNTNLSRTWALHSLSSQHRPKNLAINPLQDLVVTVSSPDVVTVTDAEQDHHTFWVECWSASSQRPHLDSVGASLECKRTFPGLYRSHFIGEPVICGDRIFVYYDIYRGGIPAAAFIQVIDWRKGDAKSHHLLDHQYLEHGIYVVDQWTIVAIGSSRLTVYTLQEFDGSLRPRLTYLLPKCHRSPLIFVHASPSFSGTAARADLTPGFVPSLESQIIVLELNSYPCTTSVILVIDTVIFSGMDLQSETHVEIPWSDWGPQHTCCFPHEHSHKISVFGSRMAYTLPQDHTPEPGQRLE
ncbi:hypothetical protein F4604DRAFT_1904188, partial [Suillus subluteus]